MKLINIQAQVMDILENYPDSRSNDKLLQVILLKKFYNVQLIDDLLDKKVPSLESITRCRRKIQSEGLYQSTEQVRKARLYEESKYKNFALNNV